MEPLILPAGGTVNVDANAIIHNRVESYRGLLAPMGGRCRSHPCRDGLGDTRHAPRHDTPSVLVVRSSSLTTLTFAMSGGIMGFGSRSWVM